MRRQESSFVPAFASAAESVSIYPCACLCITTVLVSFCSLRDCIADIDITSAIDITGKNFRLGCFPLPLPGICGLNGGNKNQLLVGAPDDVVIFGISFDRGRADNTTDGNGGAIKLTGGSMTLKESQFFDHRAEVRSWKTYQ
jgi:hypothetical protein